MSSSPCTAITEEQPCEQQTGCEWATDRCRVVAGAGSSRKERTNGKLEFIIGGSIVGVILFIALLAGIRSAWKSRADAATKAKPKK